MSDPIIIATLCGGVSMVISVFFYNLRRSRCFLIETPCIKCSRTIMDIKEMEQDALQFPKNISYQIKKKITNVYAYQTTCNKSNNVNEYK